MFQRKITIRENRLLNVWDNEKTDRQPMIFLHGLTGNVYQLQHYYNHFKDRFRCIALDFRGRGNSGKAEDNSSLEQHALDIIDMIDQMKLSSPILVGYSMGAFVAALVSTKVACKALVLLDGVATMDDHQDQIVRPTFPRLSNRYTSKQEYVETVLNNYSNMGIHKTDELVNAVSYEVSQYNDGWFNKGDEKTIASDWASFYKFNIKEVGRDISCPTLLFEATGSIGQFDELFKKEHYLETEKSIQDLEVAITDASHYTLVFEKRLEVIQIMDNFLERVL